MSKTPAAIDEKYIDLVAQYVRGRLPDDIANNLVNNDADAQRMFYALVSLKKDVEAQLAAKRARDDVKRVELEQRGDDGTLYRRYRAEDADWRARAIRFLTAIEDHILATKERMSNYRSSEEVKYHQIGAQQERSAGR